MAGINHYDYKMKRAMRRKNHIARDLMSNKYRQRIKESKRFRQEDGGIEEYLPD